MAVKFISHVDEKEVGDWFIKLTDTLSEQSVICEDLDIYEKHLEKLASEYGNDVEIVWSKSKTLSIKSYNDLNEKMDKLKEKYAQEIENINSKNSNNEGGFNPNE